MSAPASKPELVIENIFVLPKPIAAALHDYCAASGDKTALEVDGEGDP